MAEEFVAVASNRDGPAHVNHGHALLRLRRYEEAAGSYDAAIALNGAIAEAHLGRGVALRALRRWKEALASYARAIELKEDYTEAYFNRGNLWVERQDEEAALADYARVNALAPEFAEGHYNRANVLKSLKRHEAALAGYDRAIALKPGHVEAYLNRGIVLRELKQLDAALASYEAALAHRPDYAEAHCNRGLAERELGLLETALASCDRAIALNPGYAEAYSNRGLVLRDMRRLDEAVQSCDRAIALNPRLAEAFSNRSLLEREMRQYSAALADCDRAIALDAECAAAYSNRSLILRELGHIEAALASCNQAIALQPDFGEAYANRGNLHYEMNEAHAAIADYDRAVALNDTLFEPHFNRSMARLLAGDFERGWAEYEWRWRDEGSALARDRRPFSQPLWLGAERLSGKRILLYHEQGLGDTVQFCRYAAQVARLGAEVILEVPGALRNLLEGLDGVSHLAVRGEALPPFDYQCPLLSLPLALKTTLATVPGREPYLRSDARRVRYWTEKLGPRDRPRVGLVWSGGARPNQPELWSVNGRRNIALAKLEPLAHAGIDFYSLQKGEPAESELAHVLAGGWQGPRLRDHTRELRDFADTAALIGQLDLVISVDTSTAHVAGALGKPVWLLNRYDTCWRWLLDRDDSPWYPTLRLYRQERRGEWEPVVERVRADLQRWADDRTPRAPGAG